MKFGTKLLKIGNSVGLIIPSLICKSFGLDNSSQVIIEIKDNKIIITKEE